MKTTTELLASMDEFTKHYLIAALWLGLDDDDVPMDENYGLEDIALSALQQAIEECAEFQKDNKSLLLLAYNLYDKYEMESHIGAFSGAACAGHDYWLTRNGHGVGFWDRGMGDVGEELTKACEYQERNLYVGDDGLIYMS